MNNKLDNTPQVENNEQPRRKTLYVPDEEILAYNKKKAEGILDESAHSKITAPDQTTSDETNTEPKVKKNSFFNKLKAFTLNLVPKKNDGIKRIIIKSVAIVAAITLVCSIVYLSMYFIDLSQQDAKIENIRATYELNREDVTINNDGQFSKFDPLKKQNNDIRGWIEIPGTEINNPVYQTTNNQFYITHDMNKESNSYGALFLDYLCNIDPKALTQNQIIYGHNMRYGAMFGTLNDYRNLDYYKANPIINFETLYENRKYKIFAMMITNSSVDSTFGYDFTPYRVSFASQDDFIKWIGYCKDRSLIDTNVDVLPQDEIITLSTCCYDFDNARFIVMARLVRENEDKTVDTSSAQYNSDELYSAEFYAKKGMAIPQIPSN